MLFALKQLTVSTECRITKGSTWKQFYIQDFLTLTSDISKMCLSNNICAAYLSRELFSVVNTQMKSETDSLPLASISFVKIQYFNKALILLLVNSWKPDCLGCNLSFTTYLQTPWSGYLPCLHLSFPVCKMKIITESTLCGSQQSELNYYM